jgi:pyridoxal phosphate enzyme (YggS family)
MMAMQSELTERIRERYGRVRDTVAEHAQKAGRPPDSVRVVVVTKTQPLGVVQAALAAGVQVLGENYPEEAAEKIEGLRQALAAGPGFNVEWHMIGHVQSRKAKLVAGYFSLVHSLDGMKVAQKLNHAAGELARQIPVLLEFNVGGEQSKHGWDASEKSLWPQLVPEVEAILALPNLRVQGVMTMPPLAADPEEARTYFRRLRRLRDFLAPRVPGAEWSELSMGTSADYAVAVEEGATLVRVGQAVLGPRAAAEGE